jgi:tRNA (guanosine-2'-O-)-methyltransferase
MQALLDAGGRPPADADPFAIAGLRLTPEEVIRMLAPVMTPARVERLREVVAGRTRTVAPVIEGLSNTGNVSAVLRSAEALGYQDVHVIRGQNERFKHSTRTSQGAERWLDLYRWDGPEACVRHLKAQGYRVVATHLSDDAVPLAEVDFTQPTALVFGNERDGISPAMQRLADRRVVIPLAGFTESFNVSVAAAVGLYHAQQDRLRRQGHHADLSPEAQTRLRARFTLRSVDHAGLILRRALREAGRLGEANG